MQRIYATTHTSNFTVINNTLINSAIPAKAQKVLLYLLSKPSDWKLRVTDLKHRLGLSTYSVRQALRWLMANGYAYFERLKSGFTNWFIYDVPKIKQAVNPDLKPHVEIPQVEIQTVLTNTDFLLNIEHNNTEPKINKAEQSVVVVNAGALEEESPMPLPDSLKGSQSKAARKLLANITSDQAAAILMVFNAAMQSKKVNNPVGYLHSLVKAAQNGTLTLPEAQNSKQTKSLDERIAEQKKSLKQAKNKHIDNDSHFARLRAMFGSDGRTCSV